MRGGGAEHRQLWWGDLNLCYDSDLNQEYIDFNERQKKTRTGEDVSNTRKDKPRMYARPDSERCPVMLYKKYADKRPELMSQNDSPFYLATITNKSMPTENERWFLSQPIGVNKLNGLLKTMALRAHLPDLPYMRTTNTSVRKHLCQKLLDCNIPDTHAIHITGHKNLQSLNNYWKLLNKQKQHVSTLLSSSSGQNENQEFRKPQYLPNIPSTTISEPHVHVPEVQRLIPSTTISEPHVHVPEVQRLIPSTTISEPHVHVPEVQRLIPSTSNPISEPHVHVPEVQRLIPSTTISEPHVHVPEVQRLIPSTSNPISEPHVHVPEVQRLIPSTTISEPHVHVPEVQRLIPSTTISEPHVHVPEVQRLTKKKPAFSQPSLNSWKHSRPPKSAIFWSNIITEYWCQQCFKVYFSGLSHLWWDFQHFSKLSVASCSKETTNGKWKLIFVEICEP